MTPTSNPSLSAGNNFTQVVRPSRGKKILLLSLSLFSFSAIILGALSYPTLAYSADGEEEEIVLPDSGIISSNLKGGNQGLAVETFGDVSLTEKPSQPITGSVSRSGRDEWVLRVLNSSEDKYRVSVMVLQFDRYGKKVRSTPFSFTLAAGETAERMVQSRPQTEQAALQVTSWKNLSPKKEKGEDEKDQGEEASN